ncbi:tetratricopeptide repeat protein [Melittangium boletus]|uniref:serine/threonine-protein kinase n=1 Tax=Melittangium boletus TaxID=83453 RepID=UPI003DA209A7
MRDEEPPRARGDSGTPLTDEDPTVVRAPPEALLRTVHAAPAAGTSRAPSPAPPPRVRPGQELAGRYTVLHALGRGAMGEVVSAYDARLDRRVALKLLRREVDAHHSLEDLTTRMMREAQAMARLSHPNVVAVYDVGTLPDGDLFIAMEMVEGQTLRRWRDEAPRTWREVLRVYVAAGHGLAAAHEAGLVHRDFKPENVLVGRDGRARVTDFGLARAESPSSQESFRELNLPAGALDSPLTLAGTLLGTPRYMAPELLRAGDADARSDMFAFCVALREALHGEHPFAGATPAESLANQREGRVRPPPSGSDVPAWVERALQRGLHPDPTQRPATLRELVDALERDPETRRRMRKRGLLGAALLGSLVALALSTAFSGQRRDTACAHQERRLDGTWDAAVRARVERAFLGTRLPYAPDTFTTVAALLDTYAGTWARLSTDACHVTRAAPGDVPEWAVRGASCLERRRVQLATLTEVFARGPDAAGLAKAVQAVQSLPPLGDCADPRALASMVPLPEEPAARARVEALQTRMARLEALWLAGSYPEALAAATPWLAEVERVDYPPLRAQALHQLALLEESTGNYARAEELARQAIPLAARGRDLALVAKAWTLLVRQVGWRQARYPEAVGMMLALESAVECADDDATRAEALSTEAIVYQGLGRYEDARRLHARALELRREVLGPEHPLVAASLNNLGSVLSAMGKFEEARDDFERALALRRKTQGPSHPLVALSYSNLGSTLLELGRYDEAREMHEHALAIRKKVLGTEHPDVASSLNNLGLALRASGRAPEALALQEQALAIRKRALGPEHPDVANCHTSLGVSLRDLGRLAEARAHFELSLSLQEKALGPEHPDLADPLDELGTLLREMGQPAEARAHHRRALALEEKAFGPEHPLVATTLQGLGDAERDLGHGDKALSAYARALAVRRKALGPEHPLVAQSLEAQGRLLVALRRWKEAVPLLDQALRLTPEPRRADVRSLLAQARAALPPPPPGEAGRTLVAEPVP